MIHLPTVVTTQARKVGLGWLKDKFRHYKDLEKENAALKAQLDPKLAFERLMAKMEYRDGAYWKNDGSGPYCKVCLHKDHIAMPLDEGATRGVYQCPVDQSSYWSEQYRERRRNAPPRFRSWHRQRAYLEAQARGR